MFVTNVMCGYCRGISGLQGGVTWRIYREQNKGIWSNSSVIKNAQRKPNSTTLFCRIFLSHIVWLSLKFTYLQSQNWDFSFLVQWLSTGVVQSVQLTQQVLKITPFTQDRNTFGVRSYFDGVLCLRYYGMFFSKC